MNSAKERLAPAQVSALLRLHGLPATAQRRAVWEELARRSDHPTPDAVFESVAKRHPGISRPTVYRILEAFVTAGLARRVHHPGAASRFDARIDRHHHLVCSRCERIEDWEEPELLRLRFPNPRKSGFAIQDYSVHFTGLCARCARAGASKTRKVAQ